MKKVSRRGATTPQATYEEEWHHYLYEKKNVDGKEG